MEGPFSIVINEKASHPGICNIKYKKVEAYSLGLQGILYDWMSICKGKTNDSWY